MKNVEQIITDIIAKEVRLFNGWKVSDELFDKTCTQAARKVIKRLKLIAIVRKTRTGKRRL